MSSQQSNFEGIEPVREQHKFDIDALTAFFRSNIGCGDALKVSQFKGGQSNPTYLVEGDSKHYVMRRKPPGATVKSAHAVEREYRVLKALEGTGVPAPKVFTFCEDESVIGSQFMIMEYVPGRIFWDPTLKSLDSADRWPLYDEMARALAALHKVDHRHVGLTDFGKAGNYFDRQLARWSKQYLAGNSTDDPNMRRLIEWLPANMPDFGDEVSIIHGDFRLDNMIVDLSQPKIRAVLDWELSTLGHPLGDLSYQCMQWRLPREVIGGMMGVDRRSVGVPTEEEYVGLYCAHANRPNVQNWEYLLAYNMFRFAAILYGVMERAKTGTASSPQAMEVSRFAPNVARMASEIVDGLT